MAKLGIRNNKMLIFMCINLTNLCCHSVYSVLAAFFPQEAKKKGISEDAVGIVFASFAGVICLCSPMAGGWMTHYGKVWVYITGIVLVSVSTVLFAGATMMPDGMPFGSWCLSMRLLQGVGSAMEETAAYAIIADLDPENLSFYLGITEISTGLGYMVGPALGGWLFSVGGFTTPFLVLGLLLLPTAAIIYFRVPMVSRDVSKEVSDGKEVTIHALLRNPQARRSPLPGAAHTPCARACAPPRSDASARAARGSRPPRASRRANHGRARRPRRCRPPLSATPAAAGARAACPAPQVMIIAIASMLANSDYAFLEPTLGDHTTANGVAATPDSIGMLFSISSVAYTLSCPLIGILANRSRFGPRRVIVSGLILQLIGFLLIGPSPMLQMGDRVQMPQVALALVLFGLGESMSMTPVMDGPRSSRLDSLFHVHPPHSTGPRAWTRARSPPRAQI
eukprot:Transcript_3544.p2 GENE.Transcript_3544~~Transcript_3544.p2  ORF type:complete len:452 (-),score=111.57 Transcript_3544:2546-3901(-)